MMYRLIFREGGAYKRDTIARQLMGQNPNATFDAELLAEQCLAELRTIAIPKSALAISADEALEDDEFGLGFDPDDSTNWVPGDAIFLTRPARDGSVVCRHLVGAASLPCGVTVEVLPKVGNQDDVEVDRASLKRMWSFASDLNLREHDARAGVEDDNSPLNEYLARRFLDEVDVLISRGLRSQYVECEDNLSTVRGRLLVSQNLRKNLLSPQRFYCRFEEFSPDRPENRLIRSAVLKLSRCSVDSDNRRRAFHLNERLHEIPVSSNISSDLSRWKHDRLMTDYRDIRQTCRWILQDLNPSPIAGRAQMFGCFVRMNDVFERYVGRWMDIRLRASGRSEHVLVQGQRNRPRASPASRQLCSFGNGKFQNMRPDSIVIDADRNCIAVMDAKWKNPNPGGAIASREDMLQMFAYARHWLTDDNPADCLISLVFPVAADTTSQAFRFNQIRNVYGIALKFLLPRRMNDASTSWREGLTGLSQEQTDRFSFLTPLTAAPPP